VRQTQPGARLTMRRPLGARLTADFDLGGALVRFGDAQYDYDLTFAQAGLTWKRGAWGARLGWRGTHEAFRNEPLRRPSGLAIPGAERLRLDSQRVDLRLEWRQIAPGLNLLLDAAWMDSASNGSAYEDRARWQIRPALDWRRKPWRLRLSGDRTQVRYAERISTATDQRPVHQWRDHLQLTAEYALPRGFTLAARQELTRFRSRRATESYTQHLAQLVISREF
jgi:hypothetical protein